MIQKYLYVFFLCREDNRPGSDASQHEVTKGSESPNSFLDQECRRHFPVLDEDAVLYCYEYDQNQGPPPVRRDNTTTYGTHVELFFALQSDMV